MPKAASNKKVDKKSASIKSTTDKVSISDKETAPKQALESIRAKGNILRRFLPVLIVIGVVTVLAIAAARGKQTNQTPIAKDSPKKVNEAVLAAVNDDSEGNNGNDISVDKQAANSNEVSLTKPNTASSPTLTVQPSAAPSLQSTNSSNASNNTTPSNPEPEILPPHDTPNDQPNGHRPSESANPIAGTVSNLVHNTLLLDLGNNINLQVL